MGRCFKCGRGEEDVRLFDGVLANDTVKICEKCSLIEGLPILKSPSTDQLKKSEKSDYVYKRLRKMAGFKDEKPAKSVFEELKELETHPELEKPDEKPAKFVENFHWTIQSERRRKGFTQRQLAEAIGESETAIAFIERAVMPENSLPVIKKLEQFFRKNLIKSDSGFDSLLKEEKYDDGPVKILDFKKDRIERITISDLREIQRVIDQDFPKKTAEQIGREQTEDFGKPDKSGEKAPPLRHLSEEYLKRQREILNLRRVGSDTSKVPTLSELVEKKKIRAAGPDAKSILGNEIEVVDEDE